MELKQLLSKYGFYFKKAFGQNFLTDEDLLDDIVAKTLLPVSKVAAILLMLEVKDVIKALPGKRYKIL